MRVHTNLSQKYKQKVANGDGQSVLKFRQGPLLLEEPRINSWYMLEMDPKSTYAHSAYRSDAGTPSLRAYPVDHNLFHVSGKSVELVHCMNMWLENGLNMLIRRAHDQRNYCK